MAANVYIASHSTEEARALADRLREKEIEVVSTWHHAEEGSPDNPFLPDEQMADRNFPQIEQADVLVLLAGDGRSSLVETGYALGAGKGVMVLGPRPTGILVDPGSVEQYDSEADLVDRIKGWGHGCW